MVILRPETGNCQVINTIFLRYNSFHLIAQPESSHLTGASSVFYVTFFYIHVMRKEKGKAVTGSVLGC